MSFFLYQTVPSKADLEELFALSKHDWDKGCALPLSLIQAKSATQAGHPWNLLAFFPPADTFSLVFLHQAQSTILF